MTRESWWAAATLLLGLSSTVALAREGVIIGPLEVGPRYSAIRTESGATGDPIAYVFRNNSAPGRRILSACPPPLNCKLNVSYAKETENTPEMGFKEGASGWFEILEASSPRMEADVERRSNVDTRFGPLAVTSEDRIQWRGKFVLPEVTGQMKFVGSYEIGDASSGSDVLLVQTSLTGACTEMLTFVVVSAKGITASERFGTCTSLYRAVQGYNSPVITVHMVGYQGKLDPANPMRNSIRNRETYVFQNGKLTHLAAK